MSAIVIDLPTIHLLDVSILFSSILNFLISFPMKVILLSSAEVDVTPDLSALLIIERIFNKLNFVKFFPILVEIYTGFEKSLKNTKIKQIIIIGEKIINTTAEINLSINIFNIKIIYKVKFIVYLLIFLFFLLN